jgi:hypothetical protein
MLCAFGLERRVVARTVGRVAVVGRVNYFLTNVSVKLYYLILFFLINKSLMMVGLVVGD